jgi:CRISPR type IV-associated protein Csf3
MRSPPQSSHSALRVELHLCSPVVAPRYPWLLDSLLAACAVEDALADADPDDPRPLRELGEALPLAITTVAGEPIWQASALVPRASDSAQCFSQSRRMVRRTDETALSDALAQGVVRTRGFDPADPKPYAYKLDTARGLLKNAATIYTLRQVDVLEAWCIGDADAIEALLTNHARQVGPIRRLGHGRVAQVRVMPDDKAHDFWRLRPLPIEQGDASQGGVDGTIQISMRPRPPYWSGEGAMPHSTPAAVFW